MKKRVVVGMSGGIDSSVAALLVARAGHQALGATMLVYSGGKSSVGGCDACYSPDEDKDAELAARVCAQLGIPHRTVDLRAEYRELVIDYVRAEYLAGRTPNPCVRCNQRLKFGLLFEKLCAETGLEYDAFATGHYCRLDRPAGRGGWVVRKAADAAKDQSYFLCMLGQAQLSRVMFPLAELAKPEVRAIAREAGLPNHDRPESQDFAAGGYRALLDLPEREGPVVDADGRRIGSHRGVWDFTIGQRRGLGIGGRAGDSPEPLYVTGLDAAANIVTAGPDAALYRSEISLGEVNWAAREIPGEPLRLTVKIRYRAKEAPATVTALPDGRALVRFDEPQRAVAAGQWAVFYEGDLLEGGGVIE